MAGEFIVCRFCALCRQGATRIFNYFSLPVLLLCPLQYAVFPPALAAPDFCAHDEHQTQRILYLAYVAAFPHAGASTDAYLVQLGSSDQSYGIKRLDNDQVIVVDDATQTQPFTSVTHPATGRYQYLMTLETSVSYLISWRVIPTLGADPIYEVQQVGPLGSNDGLNIYADFKGTLQTSSYAALGLRMYDKEAVPINADDVILTVQNATTGEAVFTDRPDKIEQGVYVLVWPIPSGQATGPYRACWTYWFDGAPKTLLADFVVTPSGGRFNIPTLNYMALRMMLEDYLPQVQAIPIRHLAALPSLDNQSYHFGNWKNWNQMHTPVIYRNDKPLRGGYDVDYLSGEVRFIKPNLPEDVVHADFNFRFFDDAALRMFLENGVNSMNIYPPQTAVTPDNVSGVYIPPSVYQAASDALRTFISAVWWPQNRALFESDKLADKVIDSAQAMQKEYADKSEKLCEQKKLFPYRGLTAIVITPMFALPGGRARFFRYLFGGGS